MPTIRLLCKRIASFYVQNGYIHSNQQAWCTYTLEKSITSFLFMSALLLIGCCLTNPLNIISFLISLFLIRQRSGGYHAFSPVKCLLGSLMLLLISFFGFRVLQLLASRWSIILLISATVILCMTPAVNHPSLHLLEKELRQNHRLSMRISLCEFVILLFCLHCPLTQEFSMWGILGMFDASILVILGRHQRFKEVTNIETYNT